MAIALAALVPLGTAASASAKTPYFTVEIEPAVPTSGEPFLVIVRTWEDADHSIPAGFDAAEALEGLLVARPSSGDWPDIAIPLVRRGSDRFEGSLSLPTGEWTIVAFPKRAGWSSPNVPAGYPDTTTLSVGEPSLDLTGFATTLLVIAWALVSTTLLRRPRQ